MFGLPLNSAPNRPTNSANTMSGRRDRQSAADSARYLIFYKSCGGLLFFLIGNEINGGYFLQNEVGECWLLPVIRRAHLDTQTDALVVFLTQLQHLFYVVRQYQRPGFGCTSRQVGRM